MIGGFAKPRNVTNDLTAGKAVGELFRDENIVQPDMRIPGGKRMAGVKLVEEPVAVHVAGVEEQLNCFPSDLASGDPRESAIAQRQSRHIELLARGKCIEVARDNVKAVLMLRDVGQQGFQFVFAAAFRDIRMNGGKMDTEDPRAGSGQDHFEISSTGQSDIPPRVMRDVHAAKVCEGVACGGGPFREATFLGNPLDHIGPNRLLKNHDVRRARVDYAGNPFLAATSAEPDIVAEKAQM